MHLFSRPKALLVLSLSAATSGSGALAAPKKVSDLKNEKDKVSYILGHQIGNNLREGGAEVSSDAFLLGMQEALGGKASGINEEETRKIMTAFQKGMEDKRQAKAAEAGDKNTKEGKAFLAENGKKPGIVTLPSGLQYKVVKEGTGPMPKASDTVTTHYKGTLISGKEFDSSYKRGEPASFPVNGVIKGWTEALQLMKTGSKWQLFVPSELAYGARGAGPDIGPNATLIFDVELLSIAGQKDAAAPGAAKK